MERGGAIGRIGPAGTPPCVMGAGAGAAAFGSSGAGSGLLAGLLAFTVGFSVVLVLGVAVASAARSSSLTAFFAVMVFCFSLIPPPLKSQTGRGPCRPRF